jgi:molybdate/tungstate transport system permease protein
VSKDSRLFLVLSLAALVLQALFLGISDVNKQVGLALGHLFLLYVGVFLVRPRSNLRFCAYLAGYALLFLALQGYGHKDLLLIVFALVYAATFHTPLLFGYFLIFVVSYVVFPLYAFAEFVFGVLVWTGLCVIVRARQGAFLTGSFVWGAVLLAFLLAPVLHLVSQTTPQDVIRAWRGPGGAAVAPGEPEGGVTAGPNAVREAIWVSLKTATIATVIIGLFGIPLAYAVARAEFAGKSLLQTMIDVPIVIPQPIVALALLQFLGQKTTLGQWLGETFGLRFCGTLGIIAAQVFVSSPFLIRAGVAAFQEVDPKLERVARTLGASAFQAFRLVALPLAGRGVLAGLIVAWARAISEFGSVLILAEYPETAPVMIYHVFIREGGLQGTLPAVVLLIIVCLWWFIGLHLVRTAWSGGLFGGARSGERTAD